MEEKLKNYPERIIKQLSVFQIKKLIRADYYIRVCDKCRRVFISNKKMIKKIYACPYCGKHLFNYVLGSDEK